MDLRFSGEDESFREEVRTFLEDSLRADFAVVRGRGGPGDDDCLFEERLAWERHLGAHGWTCVAWPKLVSGDAENAAWPSPDAVAPRTAREHGKGGTAALSFADTNCPTISHTFSITHGDTYATANS